VFGSSGSGSPLRVAIAGAGIGVNYAESFQRLPEVEVVALCATSKLRAGPAAERLGIEAVYTDFDEMLSGSAFDIVAIATPNDQHHRMTLAALDAGAHVLCDKPLALNAAQALEMLEAAERRGARHIIPFWWRFLPAVTRAHELLADGSFGEPHFAYVRYLNCGWADPHGPMRWQFERARAGTGALANIGSHAIHVLQWLAGDLERVCAHTAINVRERTWPDGVVANPDVEDTVAFVGELQNGAPVSFLASSVAYQARSAFSVAVHCSEGSVGVAAESHWPDSTIGRLTVMRRGDEGPRQVPVPPPASSGLLPAGLQPQDVAYTLIVSELVAAIREQRPAAPGFEDGLRVQEVIDAASTSTAEGGWVTPVRLVPGRTSGRS
jgi:predicted dehydrogenase